MRTTRLGSSTSHHGHALAVNGQSLVAAHAQIASIIASRLGRGHAELLATPTPDADGNLTWTTPLPGTPVPASQLPDEEHAALQRRAERMLGDIRGLSAQMVAEGGASALVGRMLEGAARVPAGDWLHSVGGRPVMMMWGHSTTAEPSHGVAAAAPAAGAATAAMAAATAAEVAGPPAMLPAAGGDGGPPVAGEPPGAKPLRRRWLWWLLLVPLLLLAAWLLSRCAPAEDQSTQIAESEERNRVLEAEIAKRKSAQQFMCVPEPPGAASAPAPSPASAAPPPAPPSAPQPPPSAPSAPLPADPLDELGKRIDAAKKDCNALQKMLKDEPLLKRSEPRANALRARALQAMQENCKEKLISEAKNLCPGSRPKELAPELVMVFDASRSMEFGIGVTEQEIDMVMNAERFRLPPIMQEALRARHAPYRAEPLRITAAKRAALAVAQRAPSDANIGLVVAATCPAAETRGYYSPGQRGMLISQLKAVEPTGGTPLADGIAKAGQMVDGVNREALMLIISDGRESCNGDPCAVAQALARSKPHLRINVLDITGTGAGNCVAAATKGTVFTARSAGDVDEMMKAAAANAMAPANCKNP